MSEAILVFTDFGKAILDLLLSNGIILFSGLALGVGAAISSVQKILRT